MVTRLQAPGRQQSLRDDRGAPTLLMRKQGENTDDLVPLNLVPLRLAL
jgi:hypothetical protein